MTLVCLRSLAMHRSVLSRFSERFKAVIARAVRNGTCLSLALMVGLVGCVADRPTYSERQALDAQIPGFESVRLRLDGGLASFVKSGFAATSARAPVMLSISGGGAGGAFSVGALEGWTTTGTRPSFDVVTGVSTGAFIAPFAFLGPKYDALLRHLYTSGEAENLAKAKFLPVGLLGQSLLEQRPVRSMIERYITPGLMQEIAVEHKKGRRLFVLTTNLDTQQAILWNMGAIASKGTPEALSLFRDVLLASASIPGVFPAVKIASKSGARSIEELHSDGASSSQFLTVPEAAFVSKLTAPVDIHRSRIYVLVNNTLIPEFAMTRDKTLPVIARAYSILVKSQTKNGLYAAYEFARLHRIEFHVAAIDRPVPYKATDPFNTEYMRTVYRIGYQNAVSGRLWKDVPDFNE